ncbi:hypothetical protein BAUCODRAFT_24286 [Baudoinia panamericana UAMH 10762]|uniref:Uncharacterized protein n=1 Tax=Baudoinia panamericana (strain UAMH 10762) TaxID=717646 RepID=M2LQ57_BAUPA|nr:uncharacterized protein BAUCODRAFT_24286 [Baudoinia panamericana UAMH 10762]EMC96527.1 hypothetical protein BAUCODRAFT_24286 [Baudoinia panamericana UAMH 10762]
MATDFDSLHKQIIANAEFLLGSDTISAAKDTRDGLNVVVFGTNAAYTGAVVIGLRPAIEGPECSTPHLALARLLTTTCELLARYVGPQNLRRAVSLIIERSYVPKLSAHQRNIHGGGVFDEDLISPELVEVQKSSA